MGFRTGSIMTIWTAPELMSNTMSKARASVSRKNKQTGEYEDDFAGYVNFCGTSAVQKSSSLQPRDKIKLRDVDVSRRYDKLAGKEYTNFKIWSFDLLDDLQNDQSESGSATPAAAEGGSITENPVDGYVDGDVDGEDGLPF